MTNLSTEDTGRGPTITLVSRARRSEAGRESLVTVVDFPCARGISLAMT